MVESIIRKQDGKKVTKMQYVAEAIARANGKFPTQWHDYRGPAKAAISASKTFERKLQEVY